MPIKAPQTQPKAPAPLPTTFDESLVARCFPNRFRRIGDPYGYLDDIGIEPILEFIYKGHLLIDAAEAMDVPLMRLRNWVEDRGFYGAVESAEIESADGYLAKAANAIRTAPTEFELRRAKEMMAHAKFMAENKNKKVYGGGVGKEKKPPVSYQFIIGTPSPEAADTVRTIIEGTTAAHAPDGQIAEDTADNTPKVRLALTLQPTLVANRPSMPTAQTPDVGPFYDDPTDVENEKLPEHYYTVTT